MLVIGHRGASGYAPENTFAAFDALVRDGLVRAVAVSNFSASRLCSALEVCHREGFAAPVALPHRFEQPPRRNSGKPWLSPGTKVGSASWAGQPSGVVT